MKNKKFLLTIAMIMSLVMAVSCGADNKTGAGDGTGGAGGSDGGTELTEIGKQEYLDALKSLSAIYKPVSGENVTWDFTQFVSGDLTTGNKQLQATGAANPTKAKVKPAVIKDITAKMKEKGFTVTVTADSEPSSATESYDFTIKISKAEDNFKLKSEITSDEKLKPNGVGFVVKLKPATSQQWQ